MRQTVAASLALAISGAAPSLTEYALPAGSNPSAVCRAPDGAVWLGLESGNAVVRVDTASRTVGTPFPIPSPNAGMGGVACTPDGKVYYSEFKTNKLARLDPATGITTEFAVPVANAGPGGLVYHPGDGNLWLLLASVGQVIRLTPNGVFLAAWPIPAGSGCLPHGPCVGPDGNLWFGEISAGRVCRLTPAGVFTELSVGGKPTVCTTGGDGKIYYTDQTGAVGRVDTATLATASWAVPTPSGVPYGITADAAGNLVFTERAAAKVVTMPAGGGTMVEYSCPAGSAPNKVALGGDGAAWGGEQFGQKVFRLGA